jgi:hypothetical protein
VVTGETDFTVYRTAGTAWVMAYICTCGRPSAAFGDDAYGLFTGTCLDGHDSTIMAS